MTEDRNLIFDKNDVCIFIPVLNEEGAIKDVIEGFKNVGYHNILVYDGNSKDKTREVAEAAGARVVIQSGKGKGQAMIQAFESITEKYIVMIDGDGTELPEEIHTLLYPVLEGKADHVAGNRIAGRTPGAFTTLNLAGNRMINWFFRRAFKSGLKDILTGYRAFTRESIQALDLKQHGFVIETEIAVECLIKEQRVIEIPITYLPRPEKVETKLHPIRDGYRISMAIYKYSRFYNPIFFFGVWSLLSFIIALLLIAVHPFITWHSSMLGTAFFFFAGLGALLLTAGFVADVNATLHRKTLKAIKRTQKEQETEYDQF
ncbi:S-layer glycoprotein N-glycosyltransferase AglJ [Methanimicrococcus sp. OttesenSCG-928-J09]|nr:S-layer glycoprotein N-glycosyltransferase AglJ [Methanimicrococcus sp. OttesenSCG-928-J09]